MTADIGSAAVNIDLDLSSSDLRSGVPYGRSQPFNEGEPEAAAALV